MAQGIGRRLWRLQGLTGLSAVSGLARSGLWSVWLRSQGSCIALWRILYSQGRIRMAECLGLLLWPAEAVYRRLVSGQSVPGSILGLSLVGPGLQVGSPWVGGVVRHGLPVSALSVSIG